MNSPAPPRTIVVGGGRVGEPESGLEIVAVRIPDASIRFVDILVAAEDRELRGGERHAGRRVGGELRLGLRLNRIGCGEVEAADVAVLRLGHPHLEVVAHAQVERELLADAPVVMDEDTVAHDAVVLLGTKLDERAIQRNAEHEGCDALAVLADRGARRPRIRAIERIRAAAPALIDLRLAQLAPVVAEPPGVIAARPRRRWA